MTTEEKKKIQRALAALCKQRVILRKRLKKINEVLCRIPVGTQQRLELLEARESIVEALRLNAIAMKKLKAVLC